MADSFPNSGNSTGLYAAGMDAAAARGRKKVLVVEDDTTTFNTMRLLLQHYEYDVLLARNLASAMTLLEENPHCVLLDLILPDGDGSRILSEIRQRKMSTRVIVITGASDGEMLGRVLKLKPHALLKKPLEFYSLLERMRA